MLGDALSWRLAVKCAAPANITDRSRRVSCRKSYPFLNIFWDILIITAWFIFFWIAITVLIDVFRRHDISGWAKAAWVIFVVILPGSASSST